MRKARWIVKTAYRRSGLRCFMRNAHNPVKHRIHPHGWQCFDCQKSGGDLDDLGYLGQGYVTPGDRKLFSRERYL